MYLTLALIMAVGHATNAPAQKQAQERQSVALTLQIGLGLDDLQIAVSLPPKVDPGSLGLYALASPTAWPRSHAQLSQGPEGTWRCPAPVRVPKLRSLTPVTLVLADEAGLLFGSVPYRWGEDQPLVHQLRVQRTACLDLRLSVERADGQFEETGVTRAETWTDLVAKQPGPMPAAAWRLGSRRWLPAGAYELALSQRSHDIARHKLQLGAGRIHSPVVPLRRLRGLRTLEVEVGTQTGQAVHTISLQVHMQRHPPALWVASLRAGILFDPEPGEQRFEIEPSLPHSLAQVLLEELPPGPIGLSIFSHKHPVEVRLEARDEGPMALALTQLDGELTSGYGFRITAGLNLRRDLVHFARILPGGQELHTGAYAGRLLARSGPEEQPDEWALLLAGFQTRYGTRADFKHESQGRYFAQVTLLPGWGKRVRVRDPVGNPLPGVAIAADGTIHGKTNALGEFDLRLAAEPLRIEAARPGWRGRGAPPPVSQIRAASSAWHTIVLERL